MVEKFIEKYVKKIATNPEKIEVVKTQVDANFYEIEIFTTQQDIGRLIGKDGKMISAIKTLISGTKVKDGNSYKIIVKTHS